MLPEEDYIYDFSFPEEDGKPNPHLWTDPLYAIKYAEVIADTLSEKDPDNADYYEKNLQGLHRQGQRSSRTRCAATRRPCRTATSSC